VFALPSIAFSCAGDPCAAVRSFPARCTITERFSVNNVALTVVVTAGHSAGIIIGTVVTVEASFAKAALVYAVSAVLTDKVATTLLN